MPHYSDWFTGHTLTDGGTVFPEVPLDADSFEHREVDGVKQCRAVYFDKA